MSDSARPPEPGHAAAQMIAFTFTVLVLWGLAVFLLPALEPLQVPSCYAFAALGVVTLVAAIVLAARGPDPAPEGELLVGWGIILVGTGLDIFATVYHSPGLEREGNPVLRILLDSGHSLEWVYGYAAVLQLTWVGLAGALWLGLLRHQRPLVEAVPPGASLLAAFKAGTGGRDLTYRQWLLPVAYADLPRAYPLTLWCGAAFVAVSGYRVYLAAEWFRLAPTHSLQVRLVAPGLILLAATVAYAAWLRDARRALPVPEEPLAVEAVEELAANPLPAEEGTS
jgi:hypothetical protein